MRREYDDKDINRNKQGIDEQSNIDSENMDMKEWDSTDDEEIHEFLSRDFDVVAESRRRLQDRQNNAKKKKNEKKEKSNIVRLKKDKKIVKNDASKETDNDDNKDKVEGGSKKLNLYDRWLEIYHENTMKLLYGALTALIACLIIAIIVTYSDGEESKGTETTASTTELSTTAIEETTEATIEPEAQDSGIYSLIVGYIDAAYIKADMEAVALVVDDTTNINVEKYNSRKKYIELYENIKCYKFESAIENAYIVFVTYDTKLYNIATLAPSAETFIVKYNDVDKKYMIHNLTVEEQLDSYIAGASKFAYTSEIRADIEARLKEALATDVELKKVYDLMLSTGSKATEETTTAAAQ